MKHSTYDTVDKQNDDKKVDVKHLETEIDAD